MIVAGTFGTLCGILLARSFRVYVLVPVELVAILAAAALVLVGVETLAEAGLGVLVWSVAMQLSFIATGLFLAAPHARPSRGPRRA